MGLAVACLFGLAAQWLWNRLCPQLFHLPPLSFLQAVGLLLLSRLFIGHVGGGGPRPFRRGPFGGSDDPRRDIANWGRYGTWWKTEGNARYQEWLRGNPLDRDAQP